MAIISKLDEVMKQKKVSLNELSQYVGVSIVNLSKLKTGKVVAVRFSTLNKICEYLKCEPGDILKYEEGQQYDEEDND